VFAGFLEKEIVKDGIEILDTGENPEAPASREMSDLEVCVTLSVYVCLYVWISVCLTVCLSTRVVIGSSALS